MRDELLLETLGLEVLEENFLEHTIIQEQYIKQSNAPLLALNKTKVSMKDASAALGIPSPNICFDRMNGHIPKASTGRRGVPLPIYRNERMVADSKLPSHVLNRLLSYTLKIMGKHESATDENPSDNVAYSSMKARRHISRHLRLRNQLLNAIVEGRRICHKESRKCWSSVQTGSGPTSIRCHSIQTTSSINCMDLNLMVPMRSVPVEASPARLTRCTRDVSGAKEETCSRDITWRKNKVYPNRTNKNSVSAPFCAKQIFDVHESTHPVDSNEVKFSDENSFNLKIDRKTISAVLHHPGKSTRVKKKCIEKNVKTKMIEKKDKKHRTELKSNVSPSVICPICYRAIKIPIVLKGSDNASKEKKPTRGDSEISEEDRIALDAAKETQLSLHLDRCIRTSRSKKNTRTRSSEAGLYIEALDDEAFEGLLKDCNSGADSANPHPNKNKESRDHFYRNGKELKNVPFSDVFCEADQQRFGESHELTTESVDLQTSKDIMRRIDRAKSNTINFDRNSIDDSDDDFINSDTDSSEYTQQFDSSTDDENIDFQKSVCVERSKFDTNRSDSSDSQKSGHIDGIRNVTSTERHITKASRLREVKNNGYFGRQRVSCQLLEDDSSEEVYWRRQVKWKEEKQLFNANGRHSVASVESTLDGRDVGHKELGSGNRYICKFINLR